MLNALKKHWPEYLMEAAGLGIFMVSASVFTILLYHPLSPALQVLPEEFPRRVLMGLAMGLTAPDCLPVRAWRRSSRLKRPSPA